MKPQIHNLKNGLTVVFIETEAFPTMTTLMLVGSGSRYERPDNNGIAHFLEHMFYKGSKKYPDPFIISSTIEGLGGIWNAFTSKDHTGYWVKAATEHFPKVIDFLSDILLNSFFAEDQIKKEKGVIVEEINMYEDQPQSKVGDLYENLLYKGSSLGFDIAGTKETVTVFNRDTFIDYMNSLYYPNNAVLVLAGGLKKSNNQKLTTKNYLEMIEEKFGGWKQQKVNPLQELKEVQKVPGILVKTKATEQAHFCLGYRTFSYFDKRRYALSVLATVLGGGASSKLFSEVREKRGLCYYISTGTQYYSDVGNIVTQSGVPKSADKINEAINATLGEHRKIAKGELKDADVAKAKEIIKGRLLLSMEDSFKVAHYFGAKKLLQNNLKTPQEEIAEFEKVKTADVAAVAKDLFTDSRLNITLVGPIEQEEIKISSKS